MHYLDLTTRFLQPPSGQYAPPPPGSVPAQYMAPYPPPMGPGPFEFVPPSAQGAPFVPPGGFPMPAYSGQGELQCKN